MKQLSIIPNPNKIDYLGGSVNTESFDSESFSARLSNWCANTARPIKSRSNWRAMFITTMTSAEKLPTGKTNMQKQRKSTLNAMTL